MSSAVRLAGRPVVAAPGLGGAFARPVQQHHGVRVVEPAVRPVVAPPDRLHRAAVADVGRILRGSCGGEQPTRLLGQPLSRSDLPAEPGEDLRGSQHPGAFLPQRQHGESQPAVGGGGGDAGPSLYRHHRDQPASEDGQPVGGRDQPVGRTGGVCRVVDRQRRAEQRVVDRHRHRRGTARFSARA